MLFAYFYFKILPIVYLQIYTTSIYAEKEINNDLLRSINVWHINNIS